jgi:pimeloyl-ACP methyl ester carboxylesterase
MITVGALRFNIYEAGPPDGPLMILLHGFPESGRAWRKLMRPLGERGFRVVAPDMRGYGGTEGPEGVDFYALDTLAADIVGLADALNAPTFTLIGHDWGGIVGWAVAARYAERVRRLVILNAPHPDTMSEQMRRHPRQAFRSLYVSFFQLRYLPEAMLRAFAFRVLRRSLVRSSRPGAFSAPDLHAYVGEWSKPGRLTAMLNYYRALRLPRPPLGRVRVPTLILWGMKDRFLGAHLAPAAAAQCDKARIVRFHENTHWIQHEDPRRVVTEIAIFAKGGAEKY